MKKIFILIALHLVCGSLFAQIVDDIDLWAQQDIHIIGVSVAHVITGKVAATVYYRNKRGGLVSIDGKIMKDWVWDSETYLLNHFYSFGWRYLFQNIVPVQFHPEAKTTVYYFVRKATP